MVKCPYCGKEMVSERRDIETGRPYYLCRFCGRTFEVPLSELKAKCPICGREVPVLELRKYGGRCRICTGVIERVAAEKKEVIKERGKKAIEEMKEKFKEWGERWPKLGKIGRGAKTAATWMSVPFILGFTAGEERRKKLWEMAQGKPEVYRLLAKPTPYQIFGEFLFVLAIVLWVGGKWPAAIGLFWMGFLILSIYTSPLLVASVFPICLLVYLLWFGPIPTFVAFPLTLLALLGVIFIAILIQNTLARILILVIGFLVLGIIWGIPSILWTPGYPDWLRKVNLPLAGTTPNSLLSSILPIPPGVVTILGWVIVILTFHVVYSSTLASPTLAQEPVRAFFGNLLVVCAIFFILGVDWVEAAGTIAGGVDYFTCVSRELLSMHWLTTGRDVFEVCSKKEEKIILRKFGMYNFFNVKLGVEELNYEVPNIIPGKNYTLWFTITNLKDEEFLVNTVLASQPVYNHTNLNLTDYNETHLQVTEIITTPSEVSVSTTIYYFVAKEELPQNIVNEAGEEINPYFLSEKEGWFIDYVKRYEFSSGELIEVFKKADCTFIKKDGKNYLNVGDNGCHAKIFIPSDLKEYKPKIIINWNQYVEGYEKIRIVSELKYVEKYYKPICIEEKGTYYECPVTTEGPIDLGVGFIPKQYVVSVTPSLQVVVKISNNKVKGTAKFLGTPIIEGFDLGDCMNEIKEWFKTIPWKDFAYRERPYVTEPCDLREKGKLPDKLNVPYTEHKIKISANYTYIQPFELSVISAG
jgi:endogenous inhibitor of DNA gyrase (YacG/DUF329 family)